jgi:hypothetical protein
VVRFQVEVQGVKSLYNIVSLNIWNQYVPVNLYFCCLLYLTIIKQYYPGYISKFIVEARVEILFNREYSTYKSHVYAVQLKKMFEI